MPDEINTPAEKELDEVSALAVRAKDDPALMAELWEAVQKLVKLWAYRYVQHSIAEQGTRLFDADDLIQSGYFALVKAVAGYDPEKGFTFISYLNFHKRRQFAVAAGRGVNGTKESPELYATSLDKPIGDEGDACVGDMLADPTDFEDEMLAQDALQKDCAALLAEIDNLPNKKQRQALQLTICDGLTSVAAAKVMGCSDVTVRHHADSGAAAVRNTATGRRIREDYYPFKHIGLSRFKTTSISSVEWAVLWREERGLLKP